MSFYCNERICCACSQDALLYVWELATGEVQFGQHLQQPVSIVKWMSAKKVNHYMSYELVFGIGNSVSQAFFDYDPMRVQWTLKMKQYTMPPSGGLIRSLYCIDISEDKNWVFIGSTSGDLLVFRRDTMVFRASINVCSGGIQDVIALPDGSLICAGGDGTLCKLDGYDANWEIIREVITINYILYYKRSHF